MAAPQTYTGNGLTVTIADPENITKDECLQLARAGKDAWNSWRQEFPVRKNPHGTWVNTVDFSVVDLRGLVNKFGEFKFGHAANFKNAKFADSINFSNSEFGEAATFAETSFDGVASFDSVRFGDWANFSNAQFAEIVDFSRAIFGGWANFNGSQFAADAFFVGAQFSDQAEFMGGQFGGKVRFSNAVFRSDARFDGAQFSTDSYFTNVRFDQKVSFVGQDWTALNRHYGNRYAERKSWAIDRGMSPSSFARTIFDGTTFEGRADFNGRVLKQPTRFSTLRRDLDSLRLQIKGEKSQSNTHAVFDFDTPIERAGSPAHFKTVPHFHNAELHQDTTFDGAIFPEATGDETAIRAYRTLKLAFSKQQAIREEQLFFRLEMLEEAARESWQKRWLYKLYSCVSDFGFSIWRPLLVLIVLPAVIALLLYASLCLSSPPGLGLRIMADAPDLMRQWLQFGLINMSPFPNSESLKDLREALFGGNDSAIKMVAWGIETAQKLLALIGYFLMGLALRNLFKMK